ncbi:glutathione-regulated potassium-efflux system protein KefC [Massilia eurypsychrophila]|jgi:glutathione-regulated potassium-efflux system ancillary protein KefC|uniref:Glutathione-regulated potassium-efflux system protein KefC n=1 Tax=Massilia eurypsychrophila TaxID=1485217 RepID=A0A2G8TCP1_9BURK|nr:glutathione-regulated potassium-efflux system protein KefC [Massilia eurypsychrophila]PIL43800.1 glutathione-regulated potassium-efflux system protein KefC [Massilia eurypsychrophila]
MEHSLLTNAVVYLAAAVVAVPLARRFGMGAVLGYLLAGVIIGPWGLRLITEVEDILHFSEFGVVLLLFIIGLELEPDRLWSMRRPIFGWGGAQVVGVAAALAGAAMLFGVDWKVALIAALGLSLSSTAIALATLEERNLKTTPTGSAAFSILLFQDMAAIPMIALVPVLGVAAVHGSGEGWLGALRVAAVLVGLVVGGRYLLRPILRFIAKTGMREIFTSFSLLLVISVALLMQWVGMSMALGAFMAGVMLADSEYRHALQVDLEPFKGLLLGLFFIAVGMSVDFGVFFSQPGLVLMLVAGFMAIKLAVLYALSRLFDVPPSQRALFTFLLSQGGEFAFVVFAAAETARVFTPATASILVVVVALSMVATPLLLLLHDRVIAPRYRDQNRRPADIIETQEDHVIIAGFGRFGQIIGRLLRANQITMTVLDHDPEQVELLRRFGIKVFYGDVTRVDLLHAAGAGKARALVVAIDSIEDSLALVDAVRREFPDLKIMARARNVTHLYDLMDRGVEIVERETFEAALALGQQVLRHLGFGAYRARSAANKFKLHNIKSLHAVYPYYKDQERYISMARQSRDELNEMFARDLAALKDEKNVAWHDADGHP